MRPRNLNWLSLRRITTSGNYIPEIDGLRFIAIAAVVLYHVARMTEISVGKYVMPSSLLIAVPMNLLFHGYEGVRMFFVISGFVLGLPFAAQYLLGRKPVNLRAYLLRRVTRLEPPYIANLLIRLPLTVVAKHLTFARVLPHFVASLFYAHVLVYGVEPLVHGPSWSLEIEVQFYLAAPLFAYLVFRRSPVWRRFSLGLLLVGAGLIQIHRPDGSIRIEMSLLNYFQFFLAGFLLADLYTTEFPRWRSSWLWDVAAIPVWILLFSLPLNAAHIVLPAGAVLVYIGAFKGHLIRWFIRKPFVSTVGGMCYSLYLTHSLVLQGCFAVLNKLHLLRGFYSSLIIGELICVPVVLAVGTSFFLLIERPCMDKEWPRKFSEFIRSRLFAPTAPAVAENTATMSAHSGE